MNAFECNKIAAAWLKIGSKSSYFYHKRTSTTKATFAKSGKLWSQKAEKGFFYPSWERFRILAWKMMSCHHRILSPCFFSVSSSFFFKHYQPFNACADFWPDVETLSTKDNHLLEATIKLANPLGQLMNLTIHQRFQLINFQGWAKSWAIFFDFSFQEELFDRMLRRHVVVRNDIWRQKVIKIREGFSSIRLFPPPGLNFEINLPFLLLLLFLVWLLLNEKNSTETSRKCWTKSTTSKNISCCKMHFQEALHP